MSFYPPYVSVAKRRAKAKKKMDKLRKKGRVITPVEIEGRKIATTFWGKGWCDHIESFSDYENRLPRGRRYVKNGSVCHLEMNQGEIKAIVSGSELYTITIKIKPLTKAKWRAIKNACTGKIESLLDLLNGVLSDGVMAVVTDPKNGLFPLSKEIALHCDCFDWAGMCKHLAAVLYGVGARLDHDPKALFLLRGVDYEELIDTPTAALNKSLVKGKQQRVDDESSLSELFGIDFDSGAVGDETTPTPATKNHKPISTHQRTKTTAKNPTSQMKITRTLPRYYSGASIKKLRHDYGMTQKKMASVLNVSISTLSKFEKQGRKKIPLANEAEKVVNELWVERKVN